MSSRNRTQPQIFPCRKCGGLIKLAPRPGFIVKGSPKYFPVNSDDGTPHYRRCKLRLEIRALKSGPRPLTAEQQRSLGTRSSGDPSAQTAQGELFDVKT